MKIKSITKAVISSVAASILLVGACFGVSAETIKAKITHKIPSTMNIGDIFCGWGSAIDGIIEVTGLENYNGYTFSTMIEGDTFEANPNGGAATTFDCAALIENGSAKISVFAGDMVAKKEGTLTIRPYILRGDTEGVWTVEYIAEKYFEDEFKRESGLTGDEQDYFDKFYEWQTPNESKYYQYLDSAKEQCIYVGDPIVITVKKDGQGATVEQKKASLKKVIEGKRYEKAKYTAESYKVYSAALEKAKQVLNNANATLEEVENAEKELNKAISALKLADNTGKSPKTGNTKSYYVIALFLCSITAFALSVKKVKSR